MRADERNRRELCKEPRGATVATAARTAGGRSRGLSDWLRHNPWKRHNHSNQHFFQNARGNLPIGVENLGPLCWIGKMDGETLRDGIFALHTRRLGSVAEVLIKRLKKLGKARNLFHDLYDDLESKRVEVKFSRALKKADTTVNEESVLQCIEAATSEKRLVAWDQRGTVKYDCNIQQVKRVEFDDLYYGIFFSDCIAIFHIESDEIGPQIYYSDRQHKGNIGEGQFHINQDTIHIHERDYLYRKLNYDELYELLA